MNIHELRYDMARDMFLCCDVIDNTMLHDMT